MVPMHAEKRKRLSMNRTNSECALTSKAAEDRRTPRRYRWRQSRALPPGFGVRRPCGALDCPDRFMVPMHAKKRKGAFHEP